MAQWLERWNSNPKTLSSIPRGGGGGQGEGQFFPPSESTLVQTCLRLKPPFVCTARIQISAHVKNPLSICCKRVDLTVGGTVTQKYCVH